MKGLKHAMAFLGLYLLLTPAFAQQSVSSDNRRSERNFGFDVAAGQPFPSLFGTMVGMNIFNDARISLGAGSLWYWSVYQVDAKFFLSRSPFAPYIGMGLDYIVGKPAQILTYKLNFHRNISPYIEAGMDYTSEIGFHMGFNIGLMVPLGTIVIMPGMSAGWWF